MAVGIYMWEPESTERNIYTATPKVAYNNRKAKTAQYNKPQNHKKNS